MMTAFAVIGLMINAQAGTIMWGLDFDVNDPIELQEFGPVTFTQVYFCLVLDVDDNLSVDIILAVLDSALSGTTDFDLSMNGILDWRVVTPGSAVVPSFWEANSPDINSGESYTVRLLRIGVMSPGLQLEAQLGFELETPINSLFMFGDLNYDVQAGGAPVILDNQVLTPFLPGNINIIPEPATGLLALAGVALLIRRKRK